MAMLIFLLKFWQKSSGEVLNSKQKSFLSNMCENIELHFFTLFDCIKKEYTLEDFGKMRTSCFKIKSFALDKFYIKMSLK